MIRCKFRIQELPDGEESLVLVGVGSVGCQRIGDGDRLQLTTAHAVDLPVGAISCEGVEGEVGVLASRAGPSLEKSHRSRGELSQ